MTRLLAQPRCVTQAPLCHAAMAHMQHRSGCPRATHVPSTCGSVTGHGKAERADRGTLQQAGAEAPGVAGLRRGARRQDGQTPLHRAAMCGSEAEVLALSECKADVEARDKVRSGTGRMRVEVLRQGDGEGRIECQGAVFMGRGGCSMPGGDE